ncbi:hypothetical protein JBW_03841 [Pelosinus fermentans JBW45]|jgi:hypothetical protein|uniref:Uncharacterized protein n=1 Tax=Pelosinus fermentans JBW45 TaxID=1192197 RepID=I9D9D4_9FIRM|nr:hypothetical protein JBW_03841 [Pelosinus fermentans JBW45]
MWLDVPDALEVGLIIIVVTALCIYWLTHSDRV